MSIHIPELNQFKIDSAEADLFRIKTLASSPCSNALINGVFESSISPIIRISETPNQFNLLVTPFNQSSQATLVIASRSIRLPNSNLSRRTCLIIYQLSESNVFNIEPAGRPAFEYARVIAEDTLNLQRQPTGAIRFFTKEMVFPRPHPHTTKWIENCLSILRENAQDLAPKIVADPTLAKEF